jgi:hypothetical protein
LKIRRKNSNSPDTAETQGIPFMKHQWRKRKPLRPLWARTSAFKQTSGYLRALKKAQQQGLSS